MVNIHAERCYRILFQGKRPEFTICRSCAAFRSMEEEKGFTTFDEEIAVRKNAVAPCVMGDFFGAR